MNQFILKRFVILILLSGSIFLFGNNWLHLTDPDEVFYSLSAVEMAQHNEWVTPYIFNQPQFEKPIFTFWLIRVAFEAFGQNPFSARLFPAIFAIFGVVGVYILGLLGFVNERKAFWSALILATSAFYIGMGKTVFTDTIFTVCILFSLVSFYFSYCNPLFKTKGILAFFLFAALAVLTKGPLGLLIPLAVIVLFLLYTRKISFLYTPWFFMGFLLCLAIAGPWYLYEYKKYGQAFIQEFFYNDHWRRLISAEHKGNDHWFFYPVTMIAGLFPWSLFLAAAFVDLFKRLKYTLKPFEYFLISWVLIVLFVFQPAHSKLASYILPMFPALALLAANFIDDRIESFQQGIITKLSYVLIGFLTLLGFAVIFDNPLYEKYLPSMLPVYWLSAGLISIAGISFTLLYKDKVRQALLLLSASLVPILLTGFMIIAHVEPHVSMYEATSYIPKALSKNTILLTAKPYARGVRFYTHQDVAVMNINGGNYFSPHPIPILNTPIMVLDFLKKQPITFAVLKKSGYKFLNENFGKDFQIKILKISGPNYVLQIEPIKT